MRDYARIAPQFWTGETGKWLRHAGPDAQVLALYLLTCPSASMIGLYYLPLPTIAHETGLSIEGASKGLRRLSEGAFAHYDDETEHVFVPEMARFQIGERLVSGKKPDKRIVGIVHMLIAMKNVPFIKDFAAKYRAPYALDSAKDWGKLSQILEAPSKPLRSQEQEQEQEQKQEQEKDSVGAPAVTAAVVTPPKQRPPTKRYDEWVQPLAELWHEKTGGWPEPLPFLRAFDPVKAEGVPGVRALLLAGLPAYIAQEKRPAFLRIETFAATWKLYVPVTAAPKPPRKEGPMEETDRVQRETIEAVRRERAAAAVAT